LNRRQYIDATKAAISTITTVGYGDLVPRTDLGRVLASIIMLMGWGILAVPTGIVTQVKFVLAQMTARNLQLACNGGTILTGSGFVTFDPPPAGVPTRYMYGWQSDDSQERWIFRQCLNGGTATVARKKGADKAGISFELNLEKPSGVQPFRVIFVDTRAS